MTGRPLIESDRVEGTAVYDPNGNKIGSIERLMIEKIGGKVAYAVMSFGGFLGLGEEEYTIPWNKLDYDTGATGPILPSSSFVALQASTAIRTMTGRTGSASANCMVTGAPPTTGEMTEARADNSKRPSGRGVSF